MLKKLVAIFMMTATVSVFAQVNVPLVCISGEELTGLIDQYKELPYVRGVSSEGRSVVVFANPATGSFTIAERRGQNTYCALVVGAGFELVPKNIQDDIKESQNKSML